MHILIGAILCLLGVWLFTLGMDEGGCLKGFAGVVLGLVGAYILIVGFHFVG